MEFLHAPCATSQIWSLLVLVPNSARASLAHSVSIGGEEKKLSAYERARRRGSQASVSAVSRWIASSSELTVSR